MIRGGGEYTQNGFRVRRDAMGSNRIQAVVLHTAPHPDMAALSEEIDRVFARHIRRCLEESPLTADQKKLILDELSARLHKREPSSEK